MIELESGQQVDQFRIVHKLGLGGMSEVYLARDTTLGRKVALKIIFTESQHSPRRLEQFLQEAHVTAKFAHPHIITIHSVGEFEGHPYLALEYLEGQTLQERMRAGAMSVPEAVRIGLAIAQALEEAHSHGVLHRDLKPANVIIPQDGRLRVLDFGIAKTAQNFKNRPDSGQRSSSEAARDGPQLDDISERTLPELSHEKTRGLSGTPAYMAPERWLEKKASGAVDVWALGVILYEMLTQVHPFLSGANNVAAIATKIISAKEPPPIPPNFDIPSDLCQLIASMLDAKASRRPTTKQVVEILEHLLHRRPARPFERENPFRGLMPFSERHAHLFFGRNAEIEMALERLRHEPILPVVGPSGAGKSSFVAAGIVPRLRELDRWLVLTIRPGTAPFAVLGAVIQAGWIGDLGNTDLRWSERSVETDTPPKRENIQERAESEFTKPALEIDQTQRVEQTQNGSDLAFLETLENNISCSDVPSAQEIALDLRENPAKLLLKLQALADITHGKVLLFVDQLEELYTQHHDQDLRLAYMEAITRAADDPAGPIRVVFTLREDFLSCVAEGSSAVETLSRIMVLKAPGEKALSETVTKPVELAGYTFEDEGLPEEMLDAVRDAPASLPLLQFACSQLWNRRDVENRLLTRVAYEEMEGVEGALALQADELLAGLSETQQKVARLLMLRLVTPEETRRVITEQELLDGLDTSAELVLDRLTAARMVVLRRATRKEDTVAELELVHDSLIHSWKPLVRWLEQGREEVIFLDEVSRAADLWDSRGRLTEEVWSGEALDDALVKIKRCEAVPKRVREFLEAGELQHQARTRGRRKIVFGIIGALLAVIAVLIAMNQQTEKQREIAERQRQFAEAQREIAVAERERQQQAHASSLREGARAAYIKGDFLEARSKLRSSLETRNSTQARALWWLLENVSLVWSKTLDSAGLRVSVSPDGRLIAVGTKSINIFDTKILDRRILSGHMRQVTGLDFSPNGRYLSSGSHDREIRLWDLREGTVKVLKGHTSTVWAAVFAPDGKRLASGSDDKTIKIWDIESGALIRNLENDSRVLRVHFSPDGRFIISTHLNEKVLLWNAQSYELEQVLEEPGIMIQDAVISAEGKLLAYCGSDGVIVVRDLKTRQKRAQLLGDTTFINSLNFSSNGDSLAASTDDGRILVWDTKIWSRRREFHHAKAPAWSVSFLPEGKQLVSTGTDGSIKLWKMDAHSYPQEGAGHGSPIYGLAFTPDGKSIATGSAIDGELRFWNVASSQSVRRTHGHDAGIWDIAFSHDGKLLAAGAGDGSIRLYTFPLGQLRKTLYGHRDTVRRVLFSPDGAQLVSSSSDKTIAFWDLESLTLEKSLSTGDVVRSMDLDPNGRLLASASPDKVQVRDKKTGHVLKTFSGHNGIVFSVAFSPDGKSLYSSSSDRTVRRYSLGNAATDGEVVAHHQGSIYFIDVTNATRHLLGTPSADSTAKIWKIDSGEVLTLEGHRGEVNRLRFSPDGTHVATVSDDNTLRLWDTKTGRPLWRAPLMLEEPPLLVTENGWIGFEDDGAPSPFSTKQWQKAVQARGKLASASVEQKTLCLTTFDDELEIWDMPNDKLTFNTPQPGIRQVVSIRNGCLTRSQESLTLTKATGEAVTLGQRTEVMSRYENSVFVLQDDTVRVLDLNGNEQDEIRATTGATALTLLEGTLVLGFPDGRLEVWSREGSSSERVFICQEAEGYPVTEIIPGPPGTIIAGLANGSLGIWSIDTGERLFSHRLHGPVIHLLLRAQKLYAATELGSRVQFDLTMFYIEYCDLMDRVWKEVFWIWEEGRARYREIPSDHECSTHL